MFLIEKWESKCSWIVLTSFCLPNRGVYEHASWAQLHMWNVHPECVWTVYETSFTSPRSCPSDVSPPRASRGAPRATLWSAYLISLCCQSAHKPRPLNPPRPSGRTEPRVAQSCRLMHLYMHSHSRVCEWKIVQKRDRISEFMGHWGSYCPMGLYSCVNILYRGVLFINFKLAFIFYHCGMI